ncbi:hypothetical protein DFH06DRAFT_264911 [Mycena polygramma]|nr:hypothetical protein DFH06DRAFT_264911 [Mycena polygramma]
MGSEKASGFVGAVRTLFPFLPIFSLPLIPVPARPNLFPRAHLRARSARFGALWPRHSAPHPPRTRNVETTSSSRRSPRPVSPPHAAAEGSASWRFRVDCMHWLNTRRGNSTDLYVPLPPSSRARLHGHVATEPLAHSTPARPAFFLDTY